MIKVKQLPESPPLFVKLYCSSCEAEYSATRGDYFVLDPETVLECTCETILKIITVRTVIDFGEGRAYLNDGLEVE